MTTKQVADYFEVGIEAIKKCYQRNKEEIDSDGCMLATRDILSGHFVPLKSGRAGLVRYDTENGDFIDVSNKGTYCYPKRAILRIAMLLRDSEIAKEIRTQLLNVFEVATIEQKTEAIQTEEEIMMNAMRIFFVGTKQDFAFAIKEYIDFQRRHINEIENANENLKAENTALAKGINTWGSQAMLNALIRSMAYNVFKNNFRLAWNTYYKNLSYKKGISLKKREGDGRLIERIQDDEWDDCVQVAAAMCAEYGLDIGNIINEVNARNITIEVESN